MNFYAVLVMLAIFAFGHIEIHTVDGCADGKNARITKVFLVENES